MSLHLCQYMENRLSLLISNNGPDDICVGTNPASLDVGNEQGIWIPVHGNFNFTWILHGEIVWYDWYANCTRSKITVWEWFCIPGFPGGDLDPVNTFCKGKPKVRHIKPTPPCNPVSKIPYNWCDRIKVWGKDGKTVRPYGQSQT